MTHHDDELTPQERAALTSLARDVPVTHELEERVAHALRQQGHLTPLRHTPRSPRAPWRVAALRIAAALLLFAAGAATERYLLGDRRGSPAPSNAPAAVAEEPATATPEVEMWL